MSRSKLLAAIAVLLMLGTGLIAQIASSPPAPPMNLPQVTNKHANLQASQPLPSSDPTNTGNWVLNTAVSDEFNAGSLDPKWAIMSTTGNSVAVGTDPVIGEQCLILTATYAGVTSGSGVSPSWRPGVGIILGPSFNVQGTVAWPSYGYYEARIKSNHANMSSTFWLYGVNPGHPYPDLNYWETEIDIEDGGGHLINPPAASSTTVADYATQQGGVWGYPGHVKTGAGNSMSNTGMVNPKVANQSTAYHTYGLQWDANYITWYVDGVQTQQVKNNATSVNGTTPPGNAFNTAMQVILDSTLFTGWYGNPIASQFPANSYYDYVRVWTKSTTPVKQTPAIAWPTPAAITQGTALSGTQLNATASYNGTAVPGVFAYTPAAGTVLPMGTSTLSCTFTPTDTTTYNTATATVSITVNQPQPTLVTPVITPVVGDIVAKATDPTTGAVVPGIFTYTNATGGVTVTFTPTNTAVYNSVTVTIK